MKNTNELNVVIFPQSCGDSQVWVAQCINKDFAAQGNTLEEAKENFTGTIMSHFALCAQFGEIPFENVPPAPTWFGRDFENFEQSENAAISGGKSGERRVIFKHALAIA